MTEKTYKKIEIVGTSEESVSAAIQSGIAKASQTLHHLDWFEVTEIRGRIEDGKATQFQVSMKLGFRLFE